MHNYGFRTSGHRRESDGLGETGGLMIVSEICQPNPVTIGPHEELHTAARLMRERHIGYLIVVEPYYTAPPPVGVLTDRDIVVGVLAKGTDARLVKVGEVMTREPVVVREDAS